MLRELQMLVTERGQLWAQLPQVSLESKFKAGLQSMDKELGGLAGLGYAPLSHPMALHFSVAF